jgi:regulator of protease activity HflC (stomatin/prohibitin superfamily)
MDMFMTVVLSILFLAIVYGVVVVFFFRRIVIFEYERGLLFKNGKYQRVLNPGPHLIFPLTQKVEKADLRSRPLVIQGQEIISADNIGVKISIGIVFRIVDYLKTITTTTNFADELHLILQSSLRDLVGALPIESLLEHRKDIGEKIKIDADPRISDLGLELISVNVRDIMFPGDLRNIFAQVVNARLEGQAILERARGESAAIRNLVNTAKLMESNPALYQLRLLQTLESSKGNTIVLTPQPENYIINKVKDKF